MTRILPVFACLVGLLGPGGLAGQGVEEILSFDVRIDVQPGGLMVVTEEITVRALGREIRRGIYRDFPTSFPRQSGLGRIEAPFSVRSVTRDGAAEPYSLQSTGGPVGPAASAADAAPIISNPRLRRSRLATRRSPSSSSTKKTTGLRSSLLMSNRSLPAWTNATLTEWIKLATIAFVWETMDQEGAPARFAMGTGLTCFRVTRRWRLGGSRCRSER